MFHANAVLIASVAAVSLFAICFVVSYIQTRNA